MSANEAVEVVERLHRTLFEGRDPEAAAQLFAPDFVSHSIPPGLPPGVAGVRMWFDALRAGLPDLEVRIDELVADGDRVAVATTISGTHRGELLGAQPTGNRVSVAGIDILRVAAGRIAEHRGLTDTVGLLRQMAAG